MKHKITFAVYSHSEGYPPTLNAINCLSGHFEKMDIVQSNVIESNWSFPSNTNVKTVGPFIGIRDFERTSIFYKIKHFYKFTRQLYKSSKNANIVLLYDGLPLLSYKFCRVFGRRNKTVWYHNHDVYEPELIRKYSIGWLAFKNEKKAFNWIDIFSLPSNERKQFFELNEFKGKYFFIPNYPSVHFYGQFSNGHKIENELNVLFQGSISKGHGIEEILLNLAPLEATIKRKINLVLKGFIKDEYKSTLIEKAESIGKSSQLIFKGITPYREVPENTAACHIGIAIHTGGDRMNATLGTASNKIYEYAACGLPILYFNSVHYNEHLQRFSWAKPTTLALDSLQKAISEIVNDYTNLSLQATKDFRSNLNFEINFNEVLNALN